MASLVFLLVSSTLVLSLFFISVSADDFSTFPDKTTDTNDAIAITMLQLTFNIGLMKWSGDPCYPSEWDWVSCSSNQVRPRITGLHLGGLGLVGYLPDISSMDALEIIDLHKNSLTGQIPGFLGTFPKLKELNLADNDFSGSVPSSISQNKNIIKLDLTDNPKLCISEKSCKNTGTRSTTSTQKTQKTYVPSSGNGRTKKKKKKMKKKKKKKKNVLGIILGTVLPIVFVLLAIVGYFAIRDHQKKNTAAKKASETAGQNQMAGAAGKPEVPLQAVPTPASSNTSMPGGMQGQAQEVPHSQVHIQDLHGKQETKIPAAYDDEDYQEVPLFYPNTNDVETGNRTMKSETHH